MSSKHDLVKQKITTCMYAYDNRQIKKRWNAAFFENKDTWHNAEVHYDQTRR